MNGASTRWWHGPAAQALRWFRFPLRGLRRSFYLQVKNSGLVRARRVRHSGLKLSLDLGDWVQYWMFMDGAYEAELVDALRPHVRGKVLFDLGANVGNYTLTLAGDAARIFSFEASPSNARILACFVEGAGLPHVEVVNRAIAARSGERISLYVSPDATGNHSQFLDYGHGSEEVETLSLDDFVAEQKIGQVDVIKLDIEGGEAGAIAGAEGLLKRDHPVLLVEFNGILARKAGWRMRDLYDRIVALGYRAGEVRQGRMTEFDPRWLERENVAPNLLFLPHPEKHWDGKAGEARQGGV